METDVPTPRPTLTRVEDRELVGIDVALDGIEFVRCRFIGCCLKYSGKAGLALLECEYVNCHWQFGGVAGVTVALLQAISTMGDEGRGVIEATFPALFSPEPPRILRLDA